MNDHPAPLRRSPHDRWTEVAVLTSIWLLIVVTFTLPGRHGTHDAGGVDLLALMKIAARGGALALLSCAVLAKGPSRFKEFFTNGLGPLAAFGLWCLVTVMWSSRRTLSLGQAGGLLVLVLLAMVIAPTVRRVADLSRILFHTSAALLTVSAVLVLSKFVAPDVGGLTRNDMGDGSGGLLHPTTAASTAALGLLIPLAVRLTWNWRWSRWMLGIGLLFHGLILYWSAARLALALTALSAALLFAASIPRRRLQVAAFAVGLSGLLLLVATPGLELVSDVSDSFSDYLRRGQTMEQMSSLSGREELWPLMWESFLDSPLRGHGFYVTTAAGELKVWNDSGNVSAHNVALQILTTGGLIGLCLLSWSLFAPIMQFFRARRTADGRAVTLLLGSLWIWYLGWGLLNVSFLAPYQPESAVFFIAIGLAAGWPTAAVAGGSANPDEAPVLALRPTLFEPSSAT